MSDVLADPGCDCRISRATGLQCRDCPKRRSPSPRPAGPLAGNASRLHFAAKRRAGTGGGFDIPTFLRRTETRREPPAPPPGRCCED